VIDRLCRLFGLPEPVELDEAVCRDEQILNLVKRGDLDAARDLTDQPEFVDLLATRAFARALLTSWADSGRPR
jgi:hypothetical protein